MVGYEVKKVTTFTTNFTLQEVTEIRTMQELNRLQGSIFLPLQANALSTGAEPSLTIDLSFWKLQKCSNGMLSTLTNPS